MSPWKGDDANEFARVHANVTKKDPRYHEGLCLWFGVKDYEERKVTFRRRMRFGDEDVSCC